MSLIAVRPADAAEIHVRSRQRGCLHYARGSRLSYRPGQYVAERIIVAFISALSLTVIAIADFSNRMVEKNLVAIAAYVLLPALAATAWLRTCHPMADSATRNLRWIFGAAALRGKPQIGAITRKTHLTAALAHRYPAKVPSAPSQMGLSRD